jgi:agmatine deiminase
MTTTTTTQKLFMPAEWAPHEACLLLYPHNPQAYRLDIAQGKVHSIAQAIVNHGNEDVYLLCRSEEQAAKLRAEDFMLQQQQQQEVNVTSTNNGTNKKKNIIHVRVCPSNDAWVRDTGPTFCWDMTTTTQQQQQPRLVGLDWGFNAYGGPESGAYWPCDLDAKVAFTICETLSLDCQSVSSFILEGGSIHVDGEGTVLTTKECLLNPNRNPTMSQDEIESLLMKYLGVTAVIWLPHGVDADEDTNGHIDNFCCFVQPGHVALSWTDDQVGDFENWRRCREALEILQATKDAQGRLLTVHKLYLPPPLVRLTVMHLCLRGIIATAHC